MTSLFFLLRGPSPPHLHHQQPPHPHPPTARPSTSPLTVEKAIRDEVSGRVLQFLEISSAYKRQTGREVGQPRAEVTVYDANEKRVRWK